MFWVLRSYNAGDKVMYKVTRSYHPSQTRTLLSGTQKLEPPSRMIDRILTGHARSPRSTNVWLSSDGIASLAAAVYMIYGSTYTRFAHIQN